MYKSLLLLIASLLCIGCEPNVKKFKPPPQLYGSYVGVLPDGRKVMKFAVEHDCCDPHYIYLIEKSPTLTTNITLPKNIHKVNAVLVEEGFE